jgi:hypothetical protein
MRRKLLYPAVSVACGAVAALSVGVLPAVGQSSPPSTPMKIVATAKIVARGAAAKPQVEVACTSGDFAQVSITLTERVGKRIATGSDSVGFTCSGEIQTVTLPVSATSAPFTKGSAFAQATLFDFGPFSFTQTTKSKTIRLVN